MPEDDFYEEDEPLAKIMAAYEAGEHGETAPPPGWGGLELNVQSHSDPSSLGWFTWDASSRTMSGGTALANPQLVVISNLGELSPRWHVVPPSPQLVRADR